MNFTNAQRSAIEDRGGSILISAGAGSGKTAALTARLIDRVVDPGDSAQIDDFLVVTFTKAAAAELRERLQKALSDAIATDPGNKKAIRQLAKMPLARISTIHSFCLNLILNHFQALSLPPKCRVADAVEADLLLEQTLRSVVEEQYETADSGAEFLRAVEILSGAVSDKAFLSRLLSLYRKLRNLPFPFPWLDRRIQEYETVINQPEFFDTRFGEMTKRALLHAVSLACINLERALEDIGGDIRVSEQYAFAFEDDLQAYKGIAARIEGGYESTREFLFSISPTAVKPLRGYENKEFAKSLRDMKKEAFDQIAQIRRKFFFAPKETLNAAAAETRDVLICLKEILLEADRRYAKKKAELGLLDYNDLESYALKLLIKKDGDPPERTELAQELSAEIAEIYIDEYQDINPVQDMIFRALAKADRGEETNRFMVGDIKQSIYRFRGARPEIFRGYMDSFSPLSDTESKRHTVYFSENFRCARQVIDFTNILFERLMPESYTERDRLIYSKMEENKIDAPVELLVISPETDQTSRIPPLTREEAEAKEIAKKIKRLVGDKRVTDSKGNVYTYQDVCILLRSTANVSCLYQRILEKEGIPVLSPAPEQYFERREILLALCLLHAIDNPERDIYFAGLMRSFLFGFTEDQLVIIRRSFREDRFYGSVCRYAKEGADKELSEKTARFLERISEYRKKSRGLPADRLIWYLYSDTSLPDLCASPGVWANTRQEGKTRRDNLFALYEHARLFEKNAYRGLSAFLGYLEGLREGEGKEGAEVRSSENRVKIMSIHRAKGLEFPICFVAGLARQFNTSDEKEPLVLDDLSGIGMKLRDSDGNRFSGASSGFLAVDTPFRQAVISTVNETLREEEKRVLYVAMTRAKDRLFLSICDKNVEKMLVSAYRNYFSGNERICLAARSPAEWVLNAVAGDVAAQPLFDGAGLDLVTRDAKIGKDILRCAFIRPCLEEDERETGTVKPDAKEPLDQQRVQRLLEEIRRHFDFKYPYQNLSAIPAKMTVSELKIGLIDQENSSPDTKQKPRVIIKDLPDFLRGEPGDLPVDPAERGTALHLFMQFADFENAEKLGAKREARRLLEKGFLDAETVSLLSFSTLDRFFDTPLYERMKKSDFVKREMRFNLSIPVEELKCDVSPGSGEFVLVQGVIDCFFRNPDNTYTVVDFKTDRVGGENGPDLLRQRHADQLGYYCRAVTEMTQRPVSKGILFSFSLMREVEIALDPP